MDSDRTLTQKIVLWVLLVMAVLFTVINVILKFLPGIAFEDTLLRKVYGNAQQTVYSGKKNGEKITINSYPDENGHVVRLIIGDSIDNTYRVVYPGGTISNDYGIVYDRLTIICNDEVLFDGGYNPNAGEPAVYCDLDGEIDPFGYVRISYPGSSDPWYRYELSQSQVMAFVNGPETTTRGSWVHYGMALFCSVICAVAVAFPYTLFELKHYWSVKDPEPTDFYLRCNEAAGAVVAFVILIVYIIGVTKIV